MGIPIWILCIAVLGEAIATIASCCIEKENNEEIEDIKEEIKCIKAKLSDEYNMEEDEDEFY